MKDERFNPFKNDEWKPDEEGLKESFEYFQEGVRETYRQLYHEELPKDWNKKTQYRTNIPPKPRIIPNWIHKYFFTSYTINGPGYRINLRPHYFGWKWKITINKIDEFGKNTFTAKGQMKSENKDEVIEKLKSVAYNLLRFFEQVHTLGIDIKQTKK